VPLTITSASGNALPVMYDLPVVTAGEPPITTTCAPQSGSLFPFGASTVTCTARDGATRAASCSFTVTLVSPPRLSATRFLAFGNSITEGKDGVDRIVANPYPTVLNALLTARYAAQQIVVVNRGLGGERTGNGSDRIKTALDEIHPEILLLEEGINDLAGGEPSAIAPMIEALTDIVLKAKARGAQVFIATLTPTRPGTQRGERPSPLIATANEQIRLLAQRERLTLVDLYAGLGGSPDPYIDVDGLHPTEAGYRRIAEIFFDAINATLGQPANPAATVYARNRLPTH
jgi:lysophospholipase L1-like esterase